MRTNRITCRGLLAVTVLAVTVLCLGGCSTWSGAIASLNPWKRPALAQGDALQLAGKNQQYQSQLNSLNARNQELYKSLAESQQQAQLAKTENEALRQQLRGAVAQVEQLQGQSGDHQRKYDSLLASSRRRGGATIEPNNSYRDDLPVIEIPGVDVRGDGELVRVTVQASRLFEDGDAQITREGGKLLEAVVDEIDRRYAGHRIGIEAHTGGPLRSTRWANAHAFSLARANAVFNYLDRYTPLRSEQLSVAGHAKPTASENDRRVEFVIHPERAR